MKSKKTKSELLELLEKVLEEQQELKAKMVAHLQEIENSIYLTREQVQNKNFGLYQIDKLERTKKLIQRLLDEELYQK